MELFINIVLYIGCFGLIFVSRKKWSLLASFIAIFVIPCIGALITGEAVVAGPLNPDNIEKHHFILYWITPVILFIITAIIYKCSGKPKHLHEHNQDVIHDVTCPQCGTEWQLDYDELMLSEFVCTDCNQLFSIKTSLEQIALPSKITRVAIKIFKFLLGVCFVLICYFITFILLPWELWYSEFDAIENRLRHLGTDECPENVDAQLWKGATEHTRTIFVNVFFSPNSVPYLKTKTLRHDFETRLATEVSFESLDWIWKQFAGVRQGDEHFNNYLKEYNEIFLYETSEDRFLLRCIKSLKKEGICAKRSDELSIVLGKITPVVFGLQEFYKQKDAPDILLRVVTEAKKALKDAEQKNAGQ